MNHNWIIGILLLIIIPNKSNAQLKEVRFLLDTSILIMKEKSVNSSRVNWTVIQKTVLNKAQNITDPYQLGPVFRYLFQSLGDFHGAFYYKDSTFRWHRVESPVPDSIMKEWKKGVHIQTKILPGNIGYLRVPSISFGGYEGDSKSAQLLNDSLCLLLNQNIKGLVLDLRLDGGGTMYPMILGLEQLLIPGEIGHFETRKRMNWYIKDNRFLVDSAVMAMVTPKCNNASNLPLVILIGRGTESSGEFLAMAFKSRNHTIFLGNETGGYITSNEGTKINSDAYILLSSGYGADRKGILYKKPLQPDISMNTVDQFNNIPSDKKVLAAIDWINQHHQK